MRHILMIAALPLLAACAPRDYDNTDRASVEINRLVGNAFQDQPFDSGGLVTVIAAAQGDFQSYRLVPCQGGAAVCAGSAAGRAGSVAVTPDYVVVDGAYAGRIFYLSPGGDGWMKWRGDFVPVAWEDEEPLTGWAVTAQAPEPAEG